MGGLARYPDFYIRHKILNLDIQRQLTLDLFFAGRQVANNQILLMWKRVFPYVFTGFLYRLLHSVELVSSRFLGSQRHSLICSLNSPQYLLESVPEYLTFSDTEELQGQVGLRAIGIPQGAFFVGLLVRDHAYMANFQPKINEEHSNCRNCNIDNFISASKELVRRGYYVIRMGAKVAKPFKTNNKKIIDYASSLHRNEFMDVYIAKNCNFFVSTATGFDIVPNCLFNKPAVVLNLTAINDVFEWRRLSVFVAKKYFYFLENRYLSLKEIFDKGLSHLIIDDRIEMESQGEIICVENSSEEILSTITEAIERLNGTWKSYPEDEELQKRFWSFFPNKIETTARFSTYFLRKNHEWFLK